MNKDNQPLVSWQLMTILVLLFILSLLYLSYGNYLAGSEPWQIAVSAILLSIPLALLYFSIGVLVVAVWQRKIRGEINSHLAKYIYWTPRVAGILITLFVGLFSFDVFSEGSNPWEMIGGFLIHSIPSIIMAVVLAFAWKHDWIGFVVFMAAALFFLRFLLVNPLEQLGIFLLISGPMAVIAILFWVNWKWLKPVLPHKA